MSMVTLLCTVRGCRQPLSPESKRFVCARGHSFDVARSGYLNLLQPQDRRSANPGDSRDAVAARRRFLERGFARQIADRGSQIAAAAIGDLRSAIRDPILDVGCGEGYFTSEMGATNGVDISVPAIDAAARKYKGCFFVVANADRFLPYADHSFDLVMSITARMNPAEFERVLADDGKLLIALPGPDDLIELREAVLGEGTLIDRVERTVATFSNFKLERHERVATVAHLDRDAIHDVMTSSYRGLRTKQRERLSALADLDVTLSRDLLLFTSSRRN
ncbi:MAG TPA: methyltransferase domain-containing protein [Thermoanaerobaculia bacterium]